MLRKISEKYYIRIVPETVISDIVCGGSIIFHHEQAKSELENFR